jgi:hypothetical protein
MLFSEFIEECKVVAEIESLLAEQWDMIEWEPPSEDELTGGITRDAGPRREQRGRSKYQRSPLRPGASKGSVVVTPKGKGKPSLGTVTKTTGDQVEITDPRSGAKRKVYADALQQARPNEVTKQVAAKHPGRSIWRLIPGWYK